MPLFKIENWESAATPAMPAGWNVSDAAIVTALGGYSSTKSVSLTGQTTATRYFATWATSDVSGTRPSALELSATVRILFTGTQGVPGTSAGVAFRGSAATLNDSSTSQYVAFLNHQTGQDYFVVGKVVAGVFTSLGTILLDSSIGTGWYMIRIRAWWNGIGGNKIDAQCFRRTDGYALNAAGFFVADQTQVAVTTRDSSITTGNYHGVYFQALNGQNLQVNCDDWICTSFYNDFRPPVIIARTPRDFFDYT